MGAHGAEWHTAVQHWGWCCRCCDGERGLAAVLPCTTPDLANALVTMSFLGTVGGLISPFPVISFIVGGVVLGENKMPFHYSLYLC